LTFFTLGYDYNGVEASLHGEGTILDLKKECQLVEEVTENQRNKNQHYVAAHYKDVEQPKGLRSPILYYACSTLFFLFLGFLFFKFVM
jgi:hypothetical protein